jgi:hypothetical protein
MADPLRPDSLATWRRLRQRAVASARPLLLLAAIAGLGLLVLAVRGRSAWVAAVLGLGLVPIVFKLGNYYYGWLALFGALDAVSPGASFALVALGWATHVAADSLGSAEAVAAALSVLVVGYVAALLVAFARGRLEADESGGSREAAPAEADQNCAGRQVVM